MVPEPSCATHEEKRKKPAEDVVAEICEFLGRELGYATARVYAGGLSDSEEAVEKQWINRIQTGLMVYAPEEISGEGW